VFHIQPDRQWRPQYHCRRPDKLHQQRNSRVPCDLHRNRRHLLRPKSLRKLSGECHLHNKFFARLHSQRHSLRPTGKWKLLKAEVAKGGAGLQACVKGCQKNSRASAPEVPERAPLNIQIPDIQPKPGQAAPTTCQQTPRLLVTLITVALLLSRRYDGTQHDACNSPDP
jgi:hypothetical protein